MREIRKKTPASFHYPIKILFLCLFFLMLCHPVKAAVSVKNIQTAAEGSFVFQNGKWMYRYTDGTYAKNCLLNIDGKTYYFSLKGYRQSGWRIIDGEYYYFGTASEGFMYRRKWVRTSKGNVFLTKLNGKRATGWITFYKKKYYFTPKGLRLSGWQIIDGKKYYLGTEKQGYLYTNQLFHYKNHIFYLQEDGSTAVGWKTVNGKRYYFNSAGRATVGKRKIGNSYCTFDQEGVLISAGAALTIESDCAILINASTGKVLYEKNADMHHANASTTKIMTCILALEKCQMNETVTASANAVSQEPTKLYMKAGEKFKLKDLLYSLMIPSHNDTAVALAEHISGTTTKFAALMNKKAKEIGCTGTHFVTPNGLDNGLNHYSTARDLSKIAQYALQKSAFRLIVNTPSYQFKSLNGTSYSVYTTNALLTSVTGVNGIKTGFTNKAGYCFVGSIRAQNGNTYISVVLGGDTSTQRWDDSRKLLNYAYNRK